MSSRQAILKLSPPTSDVLRQYVEAAKERDYIELQGSDKYILVTDQDDRFVAGVTIFDSTGKYALFEDAVTRPGLPPRLAWAAGEIIVEQIVCYCNVHGKIPVCPVTALGVAKLMVKRYGFESIPSLVLRRQPRAEPLEVVKLTASKPQPKKPLAEEAPPEPEPGPEPKPVEQQGDVAPVRKRRTPKRRV